MDAISFTVSCGTRFSPGNAEQRKGGSRHERARSVAGAGRGGRGRLARRAAGKFVRRARGAARRMGAAAQALSRGLRRCFARAGAVRLRLALPLSRAMHTPAGRSSESVEAAPIEEIGSRPNRAAYSQIAIVRQFGEVRFAPKTGKWRTPVAGPSCAKMYGPAVRCKTEFQD